MCSRKCTRTPRLLLVDGCEKKGVIMQEGAHSPAINEHFLYFFVRTTDTQDDLVMATIFLESEAMTSIIAPHGRACFKETNL